VEPRETEVKLRMNAPRTRVAARLRFLGASLHRPRHFEDNQILDDPRRRLYRSGSLIRVRTTPHGATLTFKGPRRVLRGIKTRVEMETEIGDGITMLRVLARLGLRPVFRYQKFRTVYRKASVLIALDETPIGDYLEVEGSRREIVRISHRLGFQRTEFISESYHELFEAYRRLHHLSSKNMVFGITTSKRG